MKRVGYLFDAIIDPANIEKAIMKASEGKRGNHVVQRVLQHKEEAVQHIRQTIIDGFVPSPYMRSVIFDGANKKEREILKPKFYPDQIVHWALMLVLQPVLMHGMYDWSCGSIPGRGQARCKQGVERWLRNDPANTKYCLKIDIRKFYQSVDNDVLKAAFRRKIKDARTLQLIDAIVDSTKGLNIGNYTSQWFANFYLQPVDHFIKEQLRHTVRHGKRGDKKADAIVYAARYIDDMVMFGPNKKTLHRAGEALFDYIRREMLLTIKPNWQLFLVSCEKTRKDGTTYTAGRDVDFLGYRMNHDRTIIRARLSLRMARRARKISKKEKPTFSDSAAMISYYGFIRHSDSYHFAKQRIEPYVKLCALKGVIRNEARRKQRAPAPKPCGT